MIIETAAKIVDRVRVEGPLVDCITNFVTVNDCANILLAFGASPAMCDVYDAAYSFAGISGALYINMGTYVKEHQAAAVEAALGAKKAGRPIVVDPVGCGAIRYQIDMLDHLDEVAGINLIKGNMGEIMTLAGRAAEVKGVDSAGEMPGIEEAVIVVAEKYRCTVAATGKVDVIGDGKRLARISNHTALFTKITGAGCMLGALCGAAAAVAEGDMFVAAVAAIAAMGVAGELAFEQARLPGSFRVALMDSVYGISGETVIQKGKITC
ncbi:MAG: hydroxyethylthiazole kinase [Treponema sp.]|jgi:hydroxyethylthiazole kinase|nr:hydroxyethylthiazole kinase [Treponema sp.]